MRDKLFGLLVEISGMVYSPTGRYAGDWYEASTSDSMVDYGTWFRLDESEDLGFAYAESYGPDLPTVETLEASRREQYDSIADQALSNNLPLPVRGEL